MAKNHKSNSLKRRSSTQAFYAKGRNEGEGDEAKPDGLTRKGAAYFYRKRVPADVQAALGKKEIWIALGASDYRSACEAARRVAVEADNQINAARAGAPIDAAMAKAAFDDSALQQIAKKHLYRQEAAAIGNRYSAEREDLEETIASLLGSSEEHPQVYRMAIRLADEHRIDVGISSEQLKTNASPPARNGTDIIATEQLMRLIDLVRRAELEHFQRQIDRLDGLGGDNTHDNLFADVGMHKPPPTVREEQTLGAILHYFAKDPMRRHLGDTADAKYVRTFQALKEVCGERKPLQEISRLECAQAIELISRLPANSAKLKPYQHCQTLREVGDLGEKRNDRLMAPGTVKVYAHSMSALFNWAIKRGLLSYNPATRLAPSRTRRETSRRPFSTEELNKIIAGLPAWSKEGQIPGRLWTPVIGIFSGMRLGEIVTLGVDDIAKKDDVWCFILRRTSDKNLKSDGAERIVPVHPQLIELSLLEYVEKVRKNGTARLFTDLQGEDQRHIVDLFVKRFSYFLRHQLGIIDKGVSFHVFRHGFRDALREAGVPIDATRAMGGWSRTTSVEERYGQGLRASSLAKWMATIEFPGLDLHPVKRVSLFGSR